MNIKNIFIFLTVHYQLLIYTVNEKKQTYGKVIIRSDKNKNLSIIDHHLQNQLNSLQNNPNNINQNNQNKINEEILNPPQIDKKTMLEQKNKWHQPNNHRTQQSSGLSRYQIEQEMSNTKNYITYDTNNSTRKNQNIVNNGIKNNDSNFKNQESENYKEKYLQLINDYYLLEEKFLNKTKGDI